jgi:hypothetical protein
MGKVACFPIKIVCTVFMQSPNKKAISRIYGRGRGWAFSPNDFVEDFSRDQIENSLAGLCREGKSPRIYWKRG